MSADEYLKQNIDSDVLKKMEEFKKTKKYQDMMNRASTEEFLRNKEELLSRNEIVHKNILDDIDNLQNKLMRV